MFKQLLSIKALRLKKIMKQKTLVLVLTFSIFLFIPTIAQSIKILEKNCQGDFIIAKFIDIDGSISYRVVDFCPYGCMYANCLTKKELPIIKVENIYEVKSCQDNLIFVEIKNEGTKGDINIEIEGEISEWIKAPRKISLYPNESKNVVLVISVPCNASGIYTFNIIGRGAVDFYAPSAIRVISSKSIVGKIPITSTFTPLNLKIAIVLFLILMSTVIGYKFKSNKRLKEEKF